MKKVNTKTKTKTKAVAVPVEEIPQVNGGGLRIQVVFRYYHPQVKACRNITDLEGLRFTALDADELRGLYWDLKRVVTDAEQRWAVEAKVRAREEARELQEWEVVALAKLQKKLEKQGQEREKGKVGG